MLDDGEVIALANLEDITPMRVLRFPDVFGIKCMLVLTENGWRYEIELPPWAKTYSKFYSTLHDAVMAARKEAYDAVGWKESSLEWLCKNGFEMTNTKMTSFVKILGGRGLYVKKDLKRDGRIYYVVSVRVNGLFRQKSATADTARDAVAKLMDKCRGTPFEFLL